MNKKRPQTKMLIGSALEEIQKKKRKKGYEMADWLGITEVHYSRLLNNTQGTKWDTLLKIARITKKPVSFFLNAENPMEAEQV